MLLMLAVDRVLWALPVLGPVALKREARCPQYGIVYPSTLSLFMSAVSFISLRDILISYRFTPLSSLTSSDGPGFVGAPSTTHL